MKQTVILIATIIWVSGCCGIDPITHKASLGRLDLATQSATLESSFLWPEDSTCIGVVFDHERTTKANVVSNPYSPLRILIEIRQPGTGLAVVSKVVTDPDLPWAYYAPPSLAVLADNEDFKPIQSGEDYSVRIVVLREAEKLGVGEVFIWWMKYEPLWKPYKEIGELHRTKH